MNWLPYALIGVVIALGMAAIIFSGLVPVLGG